MESVIPVWLQITLGVVTYLGLIGWMLRQERLTTKMVTLLDYHFDDGDSNSLVSRVNRHSDNIRNLEGKVSDLQKIDEIRQLMAADPEVLDELHRSFQAAAALAKKAKQKKS